MPVVDYVLTLAIVLASVVLGGGSHKVKSSEDLFSKDYTTVLKGICCIIVVMVHINIEYQNPIQDAIGSFGFVCVTLFFMISAYGMQMSAERKPDYLRHFWRNRLLSLLTPCLLINICFYLCNMLIKGSASIESLIYINHYVIVLLEYYLWFFIIMWMKNRVGVQKAWISDLFLTAGVVLSSLCSYFMLENGSSSPFIGWCYERCGLVWGLWLYRLMPKVRVWLTTRRILKFCLFSVLALSFGVIYLKYKEIYFIGTYLLKITLGLVIIVWLLLLTVNRKFGNKWSLYLGKISYEVYLSHGMVMSVLVMLCPNVSSGIFILLTYIVTILFSMGVHTVGHRIVGRLRSN